MTLNDLKITKIIFKANVIYISVALLNYIATIISLFIFENKIFDYTYFYYIAEGIYYSIYIFYYVLLIDMIIIPIGIVIDLFKLGEKT